MSKAFDHPRDNDLIHSSDHIWEEGSRAAQQAWGYSSSINHPCPYEKDSPEWETWWRGFDHSYFLENH